MPPEIVSDVVNVPVPFTYFNAVPVLSITVPVAPDELPVIVSPFVYDPEAANVICGRVGVVAIAADS